MIILFKLSLFILLPPCNNNKQSILTLSYICITLLFIQILTHIREKLRYYDKNNKITQNELNELENEIVYLRAEVAATKKDRDVVREENKDLRLKQGIEYVEYSI